MIFRPEENVRALEHFIQGVWGMSWLKGNDLEELAAALENAEIASGDEKDVEVFCTIAAAIRKHGGVFKGER